LGTGKGRIIAVGKGDRTIVLQPDRSNSSVSAVKKGDKQEHRKVEWARKRPAGGCKGADRGSRERYVVPKDKKKVRGKKEEAFPPELRKKEGGDRYWVSTMSGGYRSLLNKRSDWGNTSKKVESESDYCRGGVSTVAKTKKKVATDGRKKKAADIVSCLWKSLSNVYHAP